MMALANQQLLSFSSHSAGSCAPLRYRSNGRRGKRPVIHRRIRTKHTDEVRALPSLNRLSIIARDGSGPPYMDLNS